MNAVLDIMTPYPQDKMTIREVGLRDGLQLTKRYPSTRKKAEWVAREYAAGIKHFEVGSFLPVSLMPQFADVREVIDAVNFHENAHGIALTLNERGAADALATDVQEITVVISASEAHNAANARQTQEQSLIEIGNLLKSRNDSDKNPIINVGIAMAFGCSLSGKIAEDDVMKLMDRCLDIGVDMVSVADTVGYAGPAQVGALCTRITERLGSNPYVVHLHDTRGMGIANASAAMDAGCRVLDASLAGLGGCPFAPGATGNVVLEDLIFLAETKGFSIGTDVESIIAIRTILQEEMPEEVLYGALAKAGVPNLPAWISDSF